MGGGATLTLLTVREGMMTEGGAGGEVEELAAVDFNVANSRYVRTSWPATSVKREISSTTESYNPVEADSAASSSLMRIASSSLVLDALVIV